MRIFYRIISKVYIMGIAIRNSGKEPVVWQAGVNYDNMGSRAVVGEPLYRGKRALQFTEKCA
jgi:hypothetical protein